MKKTISAFLLMTFLSLGITAQTPKITVIKAGRLVDTVAGKVLENQMILIEGNKIKDVGPNLKVPEGATVIDLSKSTVMPGFIDTHVHITGNPGGNYFESKIRESFVDEAVTAHITAKLTLDAGFTSVRNLGASAFVDVSLRNAINAGKIPGPRLQCAGMYIGSTGSHGDDVGGHPWLDSRMPAEMTGVADGVEAVRQRVRYMVKYGAEVIKFGASAGVLSEEASVGAPQFTQEEMNAIVDEAHFRGVPVAAHAHGAEAIKMAIRAGVDSVEHASFIDDEGIKMAIEKGTFLSMDIYNDDYILAEYGKLGFPQKIIDKEKMVGRTQRENFKKAFLAGVKMTYGTDGGVYPNGDNGKQFAKMVEWGMSPMQAIQAATMTSATLLRWQDHVGSITPGKYADIVAVSADPLKNISVLEKVEFVMKDGVVYKK